MKVYTSDFARVDHHQETSLIETVWMPRSSELNREKVMLEMMNFLSIIREKKPRSVIADTRYFGFKVNQDLQQWIVLKYMSEIIDCGVSRYAILVSEEQFPKFSNNINEGDSEDFKVRYFISHTEAFRWVTARKK